MCGQSIARAFSTKSDIADDDAAHRLYEISDMLSEIMKRCHIATIVAKNGRNNSTNVLVCLPAVDNAIATCCRN